ncbi:MAG: hypothetical protein EA384_06705 [Spirochaetaceae bacterium]|nr:MAG: hypothetical protein EA384_06705 [Spirochaetaceae bacterium]
MAFAIGFLTALAAVAVHAEQIRGPVVIAPGSDASHEASYRVEVGMEEIAILHHGADARFVEGIRLEVQVPRGARLYPGTLGLYLYRNVTPQPEPRLMSLRGDRVFFLPIPNAARFFVTVPLQEDHIFRGTADTYVTSAVPMEAFPVAVTLLPISKAISAETAAARFVVRVEPIMRDLGAVELLVRDPHGVILSAESEEVEEFTLRLNGDTLIYSRDEQLMSPGLYRIALESDRYEHEQLTFGVERGRVVQVALQLREPRSVVRFTAPAGAELFVNGELVAYEEQEFTLPPGEHSILFRVGNYSVSRRLVVEPRKNYQVSLGLDISIEED